MVCPYGAIKRDLSSGKIASKCDLCEDEEIPVCVKNCPNEALKFKDIDEKELSVNKKNDREGSKI